jgi:energy-coupling factor transporter transmembrane protein EcfT
MSSKRFQFGLGSLFVAMLLLGIALAIPAELWIVMLFVSPVWLLGLLFAWSAARGTLHLVKKRGGYDND